ncbi:hypothetical protein ACMD2_12221 [Ananas comosus]|uniref:Endonuclease/exonuclease/phosphatase domain-containing protein n=1 Tax=Ananas comosus TaxID=4615 RepID=A0A199UDT7_ANACO|nr:hypothetical protein ACMD2_12221 [Ananas comosus]
MNFCNELSALKCVCYGRWIMCGDFNLTRNQNEKMRRSWSSRLMTMFTDLLNTLELIDIPLGNQSFTWSNMQKCPTLAKLDRFLVSTEWDHLLRDKNSKLHMTKEILDEEIMWKTRVRQ